MKSRTFEKYKDTDEQYTNTLLAAGQLKLEHETAGIEGSVKILHGFSRQTRDDVRKK